MNSDGISSLDTESDILLGILENLDPIIFFKCPYPESTCLQDLPEIYPEKPSSLPASLSLSMGISSVKLEAINELIHFDLVYAKLLVLDMPSEKESQTNGIAKIKEASLSSSDNDYLEFIISGKEEPMKMNSFQSLVSQISNLLSSSHCLKPSSCLPDDYSDCGYEGSSSPFSYMSSWDKPSVFLILFSPH
jgi:X box-binding protein 1